MIRSILRSAVGVLALFTAESVRADFTITTKANPNVSFGGGTATNFAGASLPGTNATIGLGASGSYGNVTSALALGLNKTIPFGNLVLSVPSGSTGIDVYTNSPTYFDYFIQISNTGNPAMTATYGVSGPIGGAIDASDPSNVFNNLFIADPPPDPAVPSVAIVQLSGDSSLYELSGVGIQDGGFASGQMIDTLTINVRVKSVPEPSSIALLGLGGIGAIRFAKRRRTERPPVAKST